MAELGLRRLPAAGLSPSMSPCPGGRLVPWNCCGSANLDSLRECPTCGTSKATWTTRLAKTNLFVINSKNWLEVELRDVDGRPVAGERYRLTSPSEVVTEGRLDGAGLAHLEGVGAGDYRLTFPDLDGVEWGLDISALGGAATATPRAPAWVEVELLTPDGRPVAGEPYRITLPGGAAVEGKLDAVGRARVQVEHAETCRVSFPRMHAADWEPRAQAAS